MNRTRLQLAFGLASWLTAGVAAAQPAPPAPPAAPPPPAAATPAAAPEPTTPPPEAAESPLEKSVKALEARLGQRDKDFEELKGAAKSQAEELKAIKDQLDAAAAEANTPSTEKLLSFWGFMDVSFGKAWSDNKNGLYRVATPVDSTFYMSGINLYAKSELTSSLSVMVETRLMFAPAGAEGNWDERATLGGNVVSSSELFQRQSVEVRDPISYQAFRQNGLMIERAHVDWRATDWLTIRAGRYLTPFGIWNEDHGSPVLLAAVTPNLINFGFLPIWQTGLQALGSRDLAEGLTLDYAATLSNGRSPADEYADVDANKAVGLRAKLTYQSEDMMFRLGGYGYFGSYSDRREATVVKLASTPNGLVLDPNASPSFGSEFTRTEAYDERVLTLDAQARFKGLRLFAEYARRQVQYDIAPVVGGQNKLLGGIPFEQDLHQAAYFGQAWFILVGYEFDLGESLASVKITPYAGYDRLQPNSNVATTDMDQYRVGLNVKPSPFVTGKVELLRIDPKADALAGESWLLLNQLAVSF